MNTRRISAIVKYNGTDISADIGYSLKSLEFTDNLSGSADDLSITLEDKDSRWQGSWFPEKGATINATLIGDNWNISSEKSLNLGSFEIDEISCSGYPSEVQICSASIPDNNKLRGIERTRSWEKAELKTIANDIASKAEMELVYDAEVNPTLERAEQTEQSDLSFLLQLCSDQGLAVKIFEKKFVIFDESAYEQAEPTITLVKPGTTHAFGNSCISNILGYSFTNKVRDIYKSCHVKFQKSSKKAIIETTFNAPNKTIGKTLEIREQVENIADAERLAKKRLREYNKEEWTGSITCAGNFSLVASRTVNVVGFGAYDGKYIITKATHSLGSGYITRIELRRCLDGY